MAIDFSKNRDKDIEEITDKLFAKLQKQGLVAEEIGEQVGESFADGIEQGFEDAASRIAASSLKINKAFKDLAKRITNQKDIFNISLGGKNVVLDIDFSDIDINSEDFQKQVNKVFEKFKLDNAIEFDSKATEKQFKDMLGLHVKYTDKLSKLQNQATKLTKPESIKTNVQEQLAMIDGLKEIQRVLDKTSGMSISLPQVYSSNSIKDLRTIIETIDRVQKGEEKVGKQRDANVAKIKKENKELKERNRLLEEKVGPVEEGQMPSSRKPRAKKPKVEASAASVEAKTNEQAFVAEQIQLDLTKEELKVEKEITKEKEKQYGYHAGKFRDDGFKAENLWQSTPGRSTGFYGTGTYLTDKTHLNEITTGQYGQRPLNVIDPDMYNLFDATNGKTADQLHQFLKSITNKAFGGKGENIKSLYANFKELFPKEQIITYEDFKALVGELQQYVKNNGTYPANKYMDSVSTKFMKNFGYEGVDTRGTRYADTTYGTVIYDLKEESIVLKEITGEMQKQEIIAGNVESVIEQQANAQKKIEENTKNINKHKFKRTIDGAPKAFRIKKAESDQGIQTSIDDIIPASTEDIAPKVEAEAKVLDTVGEAAEKAAGKKQKFAKANKEVVESVSPSVKGLKSEADAMGDVEEAAKKTSKAVSEEAKRAAEGMNFSTRDYEKLYDEMEAFAEQRKAENGYDLSKVSVNTDAHGNPLGATISYYKKATKETITETFKIDKAAQEAEDGIGRLVLSSRKATAGVADLEKATLGAINKQDQLIAQKNKTISSMSAVLDPNANRTLADTDYEVDAKAKIQAIKDEVAKLDQVDSAGERIILPEKDFLAIKRRIAELTQDARDFINASKNAEYAPTQLESHSVSSGNKYRADQLKAQIEDWKRAGIYVGDLKAKAEELDRSVTNITKHEDLKKYLEGMKEARALAKLAIQDKRVEEERQKALNAEYQEYISLIEKRDAIEAKMIGLNPQKNRDELAALQSDYDAVDNEWNSKYGDFLTRKDVQEHFSVDELAYTDNAARRKMAVREGKISDKQRLEEEAAAQNRVNETYREYIALVQERGRASVKLAGLDPEKNKAEIDEITAHIDSIDDKLNETYGGLLSNHIAQATLTLEDFMKYYDKWQQKLAEKEAKMSDKARNKEEKPYRDYGKTTANSARRKLDATEGSIDALGVTNPEVLTKLDAYRDKVVEVEKLRKQFADDPNAAKDPALVKQFQKVAYEAEQARRGIKSIIDEEAMMQQKSDEQGFQPVPLAPEEILNAKAVMEQHAKATSKGRVEIKGLSADNTKLYYTVTDAKGSVQEMTKAIGQGTNTMYTYRTATRETGTMLDQMLKGIKTKAKEITTFILGGGSIYKIISVVRQGIQYVREIDLALTELKKVTDATEEEYDQFLQTAAKTGAKLGSTISAVTEATATFSKLGYEMEMATEMAEAAIVYKNVGDNIASTEDAANSIISTMKGFRLEASESMLIVDKFNEVGNRFAITSQGIGEALRLSASALNEGGNSLDESIAMITAANEVVNDPSSVGTALKTLTLRLRGSKTELEEMGEDVSDMATTTSQLQAKLLALTGGQVDIMLNETTFKNSTQILREMAAAWEDMNDIQRASALELMGGKRQANVLSALIQNFDTVESVIETSANSAGSALQENEKYLDSIQGKIDQFNNSLQSMWSNTLDSDMVKGFVALGTELVKIIDKIGLLNVGLVGFFIYLQKQHGFFSNFFKPAGDGVEALKEQLVKAEQDLTKATQADMQHGNKKTAQKRRDAEERVAILKSKIQETSSEAVLDGIDDSFDPSKVKKSISGKKGAIIKRSKKLADEGKTFTQIQEDPKIKQWTQEVKDGEQALDAYNAKIAQSDTILKQKNATTAQAAGVENAKAGAEATDAAATQAGANADVLATMASDGKVASTWKDVLATAMSKDATLADVGAKLKQLLIMKLLSTEYVKQMIANGALTKAQMVNMTMTQLLSLGFKGLMVSIWSATKAMWTFMITTPIGWILAVVAAVAALGAIFASVYKSTEELQEELDEMKSSLSDVRSELDSVNQELETTQERMAELLAKDTLTFVEQEELDRLKKTNDELERRKNMLEVQEEYEKERVGRQASKVVNSARQEIDWWETGWLTYLLSSPADEDVYDDIDDYSEVQKEIEKIENKLADKNLSSDEREDLNEELRDLKEDLASEKEDVVEYIDILSEALSGVEYGDSEESDAALDYYHQLVGRWNVAQGTPNAIGDEIKRILNKEKFSDVSDEIDEYVKALEKGDKSAKDSIDNLIKSNDDLVIELNEMDIDPQDVVDYFTKLGQEANFSTLDGKIKEIDRASATFESLINGDTFNVDGVDIGLADLFDEEGKIIQTKLSQVFNDTSDQTRQDITHLLEGSYDQIKSGTVDVERLLTGFGLKTAQQVLEIQNKILGEQNLELFPNLKEEIDGIIDKFDEFSAAIGSVVDAMDTLEQARAEEAYSGSISIETLENLMKYTDDYSQLVEIDETGAITLAKDAEKLLIEQRIKKIKTDAAAAVQTAQTNLEQAKYNAKAVNETGPVQEALTSATDALAGSWAYLGSIIGDITAGNFSGIFERASTAYGKVTAGREEKRTQVNVSVEDAEEALTTALNNQKIANGLNPNNIKGRYSSDEASGGNNTAKDVANDRFQKEMDYWENRIAANQARYEQLQNEIDLLESKGQKADASYYEEQIKLENERLWLLQQQKAEAQKFLGTFTEGSEEWWDVANTLNDIESELDDVTASIVDLQDAIAEIDTYKFEEFNTRLDNLISKLGTIRDLIAPEGEEDWFDDEGNWTEAGVAVLGSHVQELEMYKQGYQETMDELARYESPYAGNEAYYETLGIHSEQELYDKQEELTEQQYEFAESISDTEQSIVDMYESQIDAVEEYIETLIDGYNDYIDSVKEALDAERDLFEFKKNIQKQAKDIAELERRIASLSGSTNKSEIAERRKLEAQLYEARESLNDTYYDHTKDAQNNALDAEQSAYEETMNKFVEGMRESLETATQDMDTFLGNVTTMVSLNAGAILEQYQQTELPLDDALTNPWEAAKEAVGDYSGDALELMNTWAQNGFLTDFPDIVKTSLESPWKAGQTAVNAFKTSVDTQMKNVVSAIEANVKAASSKLSALYKQIEDTAKRAAEVGGGDYTPSPSYTPTQSYTPTPTPPQTPPKTPTRPSTPKRPTFKEVTGVTSWIAGIGQTGLNIGSKTYTTSQFNSLQIEGGDGIYFPYTANGAKNKYVKKGEGYSVTRSGSKYKIDFHSFKPLYTKHAKGTTGTTRDEWAITDEPQFGDELVLVPGKDGNLSFMRKGTGVVPADLTQKLFELAQIPTSDLMNKNLTAIVPDITKNDFKNEFNFDSLVHVDHCDQNTLKDLEKMVDNKINDFSKQMNYSLKKFTR
jgi:TP901 family phage tail tape measure protein